LIPMAYLQEWTAHAPWPDLRQVEQDLIICRALCDLFTSKQLQGPLLPAGVTFTQDDAIAAFGRVWDGLITRIPGDPWKSSQGIIEAIRQAKYPALLGGG
jgi:hypothetical protein